MERIRHSGFVARCIVYGIVCFSLIFIPGILSGAVITYSLSGLTYENQDKEENSPTELVEAKSAYLCEGSTGTVLFEKDATKQMAPASITKIMTLLLIFENIESGKISLTDMVTVSAHAASMGGSQVYLEEGEQQTVDDMIKCISIASANDACVAMAEYIGGSEEEFVRMMNEKAKSLGMDNTNFVNCCGLDVEGHYSCAADVAVMGRELITRFPQISEYATTWMDTITHKTRKGEKEFGLTNTNKLVRTYKGITGLKTGSTGNAGYCLCATSTRNGMSMVAVVMSAKDHKSRFSDCAKLMDYGYSKCTLYTDDCEYEELEEINVKGYMGKSISAHNEPFSCVLVSGEDISGISANVEMNELSAPVNEGDIIGHINYMLGGKSIGSCDILANEDAPKASFADYFKYCAKKLFRCD